MKYLITIYVLELEDNKFYVGKSRNFNRRLNQHTFGKGSAWTSQHKIVNVYKTFQFYVKSEFEEIEKENLITIKFMEEKGWKNVRGGWWCNTGEKVTIKGLQHHGYFLNEEIEKNDFKNREFCIYVLELNFGKYFIGYTHQLQKALLKHENGKASKWTKMYKPLKLIHHENIKCNSDIIDINKVDNLVRIYFDLKGFKNVRGGSFIIIDEEKHMQSLIKRIK